MNSSFGVDINHGDYKREINSENKKYKGNKIYQEHYIIILKILAFHSKVQGVFYVARQIKFEYFENIFS